MRGGRGGEEGWGVEVWAVVVRGESLRAGWTDAMHVLLGMLC